MQQVHVHFPQLSAAFMMVAARAGSHYIGPDVLAAQVLGKHMVHGQFAVVPSTVLACVVIPAEDLPAGQLDLQARAVDHSVQPDNGRTGQRLFDRLDGAAAVHHHVGFSGEDQANGATGIADIHGFEIGV